MSSSREQLQQLKLQLQHAEAHLERLIDSVPAERWPVRSDSSLWSVSECIAHLNLTSEAYLPRLWKALEEARRLPAMDRSAYRRDLIGALFSTMTGPLPTIAGRRIGRVKTMPAFVPRGNEPRNVLVAEFKRFQLELMRVTEEGDGLQLDRVSIVSPFGEKISYSCYSALAILPRHQERHLGQADLVWAP